MKNTPNQSKKKQLSKMSPRLHKALLVLGAALLTVLSVYMIVPVVGAVAPGICLVLRSTCSMDGAGLIVFGAGATIYLITAATLTLHFIAKLRWLVSFETGLTAIGSYFLYASLALAIFQTNSSALTAVGVILALFLSFVLHAFIFSKLSRWPVIGAVTAVVLCILYVFVLPAALRGFAEDQRVALETAQELREAKALSFHVYSPSYVPEGYAFSSTNAYPATPDTTESYSLDFSTQPIKHTAGAKTLYLDQRKFAEYNPPKKCNYNNQLPQYGFGYYKSTKPTDECSQIGQTENCTVYEHTYTVDAEDSKQFSCKIGETLILMTVHRNEISNEEVIKIFNSMKPADVSVLHQRAAESQRE